MRVRSVVLLPASLPPCRTASAAALTAAVLAVVAATAPAQRQFEPLGKRHLPSNEDERGAFALGDVDGDGDLDLVCATYRGSPRAQDRLYLNDGGGVFEDVTAARMPSDDGQTTAVALGDVDMDGDLDIVFAGYPRDRLYLNDGAGSFVDATAARMPPSVLSFSATLALGDVDGDGDLDLVLASARRNELYVNNGTGTFIATIPPFASNDRSTSVALGDIDRDGDLDVVFGNSDVSAGWQNRLYLNDGSGGFTDGSVGRLPIRSDSTLSVILGDVDGDGDLDLLCGNDRQPNRLLLNDGSGAFLDAPANHLPQDADSTSSMALCDVDQDGDLDLVCGNGGRPGLSGQNRLYLNDGTARFTDATALRMPATNDSTRSVVAGDVDQDGDVDVAFGNGLPGKGDRLLLNDASGTFSDTTARRLPAFFSETHSIALGDLDNDGDLDVVTGDYVQDKLYLNDGTGEFADQTAGRMPADSDFTWSVALGDVDGDGDLDLVSGNLAATNRLYLNDGTARFTDVTGTLLPRDNLYTRCVALDDVDGDGDPDIVCANYRQRNQLYLNDGTGGFTDGTTLRMPIEFDPSLAVALGDVDGDGDLDIVIGNEGTFTGQNRLYLNDGYGTFLDATLARMPADNDPTQAVALGDLDGDGDLDIVCGNGNSSYARRNRLYRNTGSGYFVDASTNLPADGDSTFSIALGDVDADGDLDIITGNAYIGSSQNRLYLNNGNGTFVDATATRVWTRKESTSAVALGDSDGDGDLDLFTGNRWEPDRLDVNLLRQLDAPRQARPGYGYELDIYARYGPFRAADIAFPFLATATATIPLPPIGTVRIDPSQTIVLAPVFVPQPQGRVSITIPIPADPALVGGMVYGQCLLLQYPAQTLLSSLIADEVR